MAAKTPRRVDRDTPLIEWIVAGIGVGVIISVISWLLLQAQRPVTPPSIDVVAERTVPVPSGFLVQFVARNVGTSSAQNVTIEGTLGDGAAVESARTMIDHVPGDSEVRGGLFFRVDPRSARLRLRAVGYQEP